MLVDYIDVMGVGPECVLLGFGPRSEDIITLDQWTARTLLMV